MKLKRLNAWMFAFALESRSTAQLAAASKPRLVNDLREVVQRYADKTVVSEVPLVDYVLYGVFGKQNDYFLNTKDKEKLMNFQKTN